MSKEKNLVSIITPTYNAGKFIAQTAESVLAQSYENWEWIVVDDNSSDNTLETIKKYEDPRIHLISNSKNQGAAIARNMALDCAQGRFITFLDSDDLWKPDFLEKSVSYLISNNEKLVYSSYERRDENLEPYLAPFIAVDKVDYQRILYNCPIPMLTAIYDSSEIGKVKIPVVEKREDHAMWIEILKKIPYARAIKEPLGIYRIRPNSYSRNKLAIIKPQFNLYRKYLGLPLYKSIFYTLTWGINGILKYR